MEYKKRKSRTDHKPFIRKRTFHFTDHDEQLSWESLVNYVEWLEGRFSELEEKVKLNEQNKFNVSIRHANSTNPELPSPA